MDPSLSSIKALVQDVKEYIFLDIGPSALIASSAYETAWLAMVPNDSDPLQPMFKNCLNWVLSNQKEDGFWGEYDGHGRPTIECLPATIACMIALKKWNVGQIMINKGMAFIQANMTNLVSREIYDSCPRWFAIIFPAMLELAHRNGLEIVFSDQLKGVVMDIFYTRQEILEREKLVDKHQYPPLLSYIEALPLYNIDQQHVVKNLSQDGSLFQSPSATARAFMATGNKDCLAYLQSLVQACPNGVPPTFPIDERLIRLSMVNQLEKLGLADHFEQEIEEILEEAYRSYMNQEPRAKPIHSLAPKLYKDSLAFWLLRRHGYNVSPGIFCWFLHDEKILDHLQNNCEFFSNVMLNVHKATDLMFPGEFELEKAKSFSRKLLEKCISKEAKENKNSPVPNFHKMIKHELRFPWLARLDHLEHRLWIEEKNNTALWMGKASFLRFSSQQNDKLMLLARKIFEFRQFVYRNELEELKRWSKSWGLADMGFGREKTTYCYLAVAATTSLPHDSEIRMIVAKSAIIITVADDFYDMEGSIDELKKLTDAIQRWEAKGLSGHSRIIFDVLDDHVREVSAKYLQKHGSDDITNRIRFIWYETFNAWYTEAKWSSSGFIPSPEEYLETGMTSIATHTLVLPASCFLEQRSPNYQLNPTQHETITRLTMIIPRLLNDMQSYEKEQKEGKTNYVLLYMKENPEANIEDSIAYTKGVVDDKKRELIKQALIDGTNDFPKQLRRLHLSCLKTFQMFFDSSNLFDSDTELLQDIQKAMYLPLQVGPQMKTPQKLIPEAPRPDMVPPHSGSPKRYQAIAIYHNCDRRIKHYNVSYASKRDFCPSKRDGSVTMSLPLNFKPCFM